MTSKRYAFGVDIGGTTCKIGFFETSGVLIDKWEIHTNTENTGDSILRDVACAIKDRMTKAHIKTEDVLGIGVGVPGPVTDYSVVHGCENLGWETVEVASELELLTGLHVIVENDANVAVLGEMSKGGACGSKNVILVTLGTGVGAGIIAGGSIVTGDAGVAGEIGHMTVNLEETERCSCGKYGCLEQYASATGIVRMAKQKYHMDTCATKNAAGYGQANLTAKVIFDLAKAGDETALAVVDHVSKILGIALANVACVTNPEIIVIGGGVSKAGDILIDTVKKYFMQYAFGECGHTRFALAQLGNDAGIWGCLQLLLQQAK